MTGRARVRAGAAALALALAAACTPVPAPGAASADPEAADAAADTGRVELAGEVVVTAGPAGRGIPTLVPDGARGVALSGTLAEELGTLNGARVRVAGRRTPGGGLAPGGGFEVAAYELLSVGGERPRVGVVRLSGGAAHLVLADGSTLRLLNPTPELARAGAKVWVVGRAADGGLAVQSYGVLRAP